MTHPKYRKLGAKHRQQQKSKEVPAPAPTLVLVPAPVRVAPMDVVESHSMIHPRNRKRKSKKVVIAYCRSMDY